MPERIRAVGLTLFRPLYFGALPCVASKTSTVGAEVHARGHAEATDDAGRQIAENIAVKVRQHDNIIKFGLLGKLHAHVVDDAVFEFDLGIFLRRLHARPEETGRRCTS